MTTPYHARYIAHELTRQRPASGVDRLSMALFDANVDLNPHQIEAALFALRSPLSKGVLLADEVGLGKTIEAGLILCQLWAERRRQLLVVCPASLRKQWSLELAEKFNLPTLVLDAPTYRQLRRDGESQPLVTDAVVITSLNFASTMQAEVGAVGWDLVIIDEAHKLRNAYRPSNRMGQRLRVALADRRKVLLTATPLQNSLLELYGLSMLVDERIFGDVGSFRAQYMRQDSDLEDLRERLRPFYKRTLRNQVQEYVRYTERRPVTRPFLPGDDEHRFYEAISAFLSREDTYAIPSRQRSLTTLILRKLLASSSQAIAATLETLRDRLLALRDGLPPPAHLAEDLLSREEFDDEYIDELEAEPDEAQAQPAEPMIDRARLSAEIAELERYILWARSIGVDTKSRALLTALDVGFAELARMGARRKALIFTESRRTQEYLKAFLESSGHAGRVLLFNGTNSDSEARVVYERWLSANAGSSRLSGSRAIDIRTALVEHFRDHADIMIATEAAAEGINLQFCSLVINYDLPWNPQRIEQRIGRCHRYGQQHDVVVINFLNERNAADRRVLELLTEKFQLFSGVFGSSDEVLGTIESGVDFEKRILAIYQTCRTSDAIEAAFQELRAEMDAVIAARMDTTRRALLEHFDEDVHARLRLQLDRARAQLDYVGRLFWMLTRYMLRETARFDEPSLSFHLHTPPRPDLPRGHYQLISKGQELADDVQLYRLSHPLGSFVLESARSLPTPLAALCFNISSHPTRIAAVESLRGQAGWLTLQHLVVDTYEREEYLLFSAFADSGATLDQETSEKLFRCAAAVESLDTIAAPAAERLEQEAERHAQAMIARSLEHNNRLFQQERERLERWADDMVLAAEKDLTDTKAQIKALNRQTRLATSLDEQHAIQEKLRELERTQRRQRQRIFDVEDEIKERRDQLITALERRLSRRTTVAPLFTIRWAVI
jgi:superfamily II DNA or RNA helicase